MIELARLSDLRKALVLRDVLQARGISCRINGWSGQARIVLLQSAQLEEAQAIVDSYLKDPEQPQFRSASWQSGTLLPKNAYRRAEQQYWRRLLGQTGLVTSLVMVLCTLVFILTQYTDPPLLHALLMPMQLADLRAAPYRLLTPVLVHLNGWHLLLNLLWWWEFGRRIEMVQGSHRLILLGLWCALVSDIAQFEWSGPGFAGLSGVVLGLAGYLGTQGLRGQVMNAGLPRGLWWMLAVSVLLGMSGLLDAWVGPMANTAHLAGLLAGMVAGLLV